MPITHTFVSSKSDGADTSLVKPSDWNAGHILTPTYLGYNTIGGTEETATLNRVYAKKITTTDAALLQAVEVYFRETADSLQSITVALYEDNSGILGKFLAAAFSATLAPTNNPTFGGGTASIARWMAVPLIKVLAASTSYWIAWQFTTTGSPQPRQFYDGSGTDRRYDSTGAFIVDGGRYSETTDSRQYSVRVLII